MYLGRMAAVVSRSEVDQQTLVELITTGRSANVNGTGTARPNGEESS
jgi:hypothetical protein